MIDWLTLLKGVSVASQSVGQYRSGRAQAAIYDANAILDRTRAQDAVQRGSQAAVLRHRQTEQLIGSQQAALANNNVALSGTALDLLSDSERFGAIDETTMRNNAAREAWGYTQEASNLSTQATATRQDATTGLIGSLATGLVETTDFYRKSQEANQSLTLPKQKQSKKPLTSINSYFKP